jgi:type IV secretion system protein VirB10
MRRFFGILTACILGISVAIAQSDRDFSGLWKLNFSRSEVQSLPSPPDPFLKVEQNTTTLTVAGSSQESGGVSTSSIYPLDGRTEKRQVGDSKTNTVTKWEGAALLVNMLVSGPQNYTVMERWKLSRDRSTLTIKRTVVRISGESESVLVYENPAAAGGLEARQPARPAATHSDEVQPAAANSVREPEVPAEYLVEAGTRVLLRLTNAVNTKHTAPGDRVYLETAFPIYVHGRLIIPRGSYVAGTVTESQQAGRVKGKSSLSLRFDSLTLPNGATRDFRSRPGSVDTKGNLDHAEGKIEGEGNKGGDARTVGKTTAAGAAIGTVVGGASGHYGMGAAIGAAAGAAAGLAGVLSSRGPDVVLPRGTTMEMVLDRDLRFTEAELRMPIQ